ncbi:hypothetical protein QT971_06340 [Microcoleus sp. herbarium19]|uniref:hypothetical protein n=1 Tax=Microcoleus sp. herbarium19 TaxID=3055440 RepID=UPI002FD4B8E7
MKLLPKELDLNQLSTFRFNFSKAVDAYDKEPDLKSICSINLHYQKKPFSLVFKGEIAGKGIYKTEFGHSLGLAIEEEDMNALGTFSNFSIIFQDLPQNFTFNPLVKGELLFLKLKQVDNRYTVACDIPIDPNDEVSLLTNGQAVEVETSLRMYINFENSTAGFYLPLVNVKTKFDTPPTPKKMKKLVQ